MKIYLINPFYRAIYGQMSEVPCYDPPLGLPYLAAVLLKKGYEVVYRDAEVEFNSREELLEDMRRNRPDVVGISCTTPLAPEGKRIARLAKDLKPDTWVVAGGCHASAIPQDFLSSPHIDYCVICEGEVTFPELIAALARGESETTCPGTAFMREGKLIMAEPRPLVQDLDSIPYPARHLMRMDKYKPALVTSLSTKNNYANIITTRGCPYRCIYCGSGAIFGKRIRYRSAENVIGEIDECVSQFDVGYVGFVDDTFACNKKHAMNVCTGIEDAGLDVRWAAQMRVDNADEELLIRMKETGCEEMHFGYESGSQEILRRIKKGITLEQAARATHLAKKAGLEIHGYFMLGNPGETVQTMRETIKFAKKLSPDTVQFTIAQPFPGTELYEIARSEGQMSDNFSDYRWYGSIKYLPEGLTREDILKLYRKAYWSFYMRPAYILRLLRKKGLVSQWHWWLRALRAFLRIVVARRSRSATVKTSNPSAE